MESLTMYEQKLNTKYDTRSV